MRKTFTIAAKELGCYFKSPIAYITLIIAISIFNVFFYLIIDQNREASLRDMFKLMEFLFVFIVPLLTMRIFAEEKRSGTIEFLMTAPVTNGTIVLGKYLGSLIFFTVIVGLTGAYYFIMNYFAKPDQWTMLAGYLGIWLEGALFVAIGLLTSSWTKNQLIAAITSYVILLGLYFSITFIMYFHGLAEEIIRYISVWSHTQNLFSGLILTQDLVYFISGITFCLILTRLSIDTRIWK
ncbi:MAG: ABC transporter permease subunit [Candidatus Omnitrophota bacterium]